MRDELLGYYERELTFLRQMGAEFAQKYPKIASRLLLEQDKCEDPHVERMIEAFAFLSGRVQLKIDDEFPEITESLLGVLYPHYLSPTPSMSVAQFALDPKQGKMTAGYAVERDTTLYSRPIQGTPCRFRTCYPVALWPIEVARASLESLDPVDTRGKWSEARIVIGLRCINEAQLSEIHMVEDERLRPVESLRFYLSGEPQLVYPLYEIIFNKATRVEIRPVGGKRISGRVGPPPAAITLPADSIRPVGFAPEESMLPYTAQSFPGYRLLTEYFAFPEKYLFFDVTGLDRAARAGFGEQFEIVIHLRDVTPPPAAVSANTFQLGCSPIINLFEKIAEPIQLTQQKSEYHVIPDVHRQSATEIYSVRSVTSTDSYLQQSREYQPFYSFRHGYNREHDRAFWYASRRQSTKQDDAGTEVYLSLVDMKFDPHVPATDTLTVHTLCTNRDLPARLPFGGREGDFEVEGATPLSRVRCLKKPTPTLRPPSRRGAQWRLISHLSLNHLSIVEPGEGGAPNALREILMLYDFTDSAATRKQIGGLAKISSRRVVRQTGSRIGTGFVRGVETTIDFDEEQYVGGGIFLFAAVLEKFLGLYVSVNSFSQLVAQISQREGHLKRWTPRAGDQILL